MLNRTSEISWEKLEQTIPWGTGIFVFFLLIGLSLFLPSQLGPTPNNWFTDYAHAIMQGKLYLSEGATQWRNCGWDQSFFQGKCYLYFGIVPALLHLVFPFFTNRFISILSAAVFSYFLAKTVLQISRLRSDEKKGDVFVSSFLILGTIFASSFVSLALSSRVYEETISIAHMFGMVGTYLALPYFPKFELERSLIRLLGASLFLALASLTRISWFGPFAIFAIFCLMGVKQTKSTFIPLVFLGAALFFQGVLNWIRFENVFDFGVDYVSTQIRWADKRQEGYGLNSWRYVLPNFVSYYLIPLFPGKQILVKNSPGFLEKVLLYKILLYENPHTLLLALPGAFAALFYGKKFGRFILKNWALFAFFIPLWALTLSMDCVIHRYQFEVCAAYLLLAVPFLIASSSRMKAGAVWFQILAFVLGTGFTAYQTFQILERHWSVL